MKTLFKKLNNDKNKISNKKRDEYLNYIFAYLKDELGGYINKLNPKLKIFSDVDYKSPIIKKLRMQGIELGLRGLPTDTYVINPNNNEFKKFINDFFIAENECVKKINNELYYDDNDLKNHIFKKEFENIFSNIYLYILNKDEKSGGYCASEIRYDHKNENFDFYTFNLFYSTKNEKNSFGIKDGDLYSKEIAIEFIKDYFVKYKYQELRIYSGYFEYL